MPALLHDINDFLDLLIFLLKKKQTSSSARKHVRVWIAVIKLTWPKFAGIFNGGR